MAYKVLSLSALNKADCGALLQPKCFGLFFHTYQLLSSVSKGISTYAGSVGVKGMSANRIFGARTPHLLC